MKDIILSRESTIWIVLMTLTVTTWLLGTHQSLLFSTLPAEGSAILLLAFVKVHMVIYNFMEVRHAPLALKICLNLWVGIVLLLLIGMYIGWIAFA